MRWTSTNPYYDNLGDIDFLIRIERGKPNCPIFEMDLPNLYNKYVKIPDGYERDETVGKLFDRIENTNDSFFISGRQEQANHVCQYFAQTSKKAILLTRSPALQQLTSEVWRFIPSSDPLRPLLPEDEE